MDALPMRVVVAGRVERVDAAGVGVAARAKGVGIHGNTHALVVSHVGVTCRVEGKDAPTLE